MKIKILKIHKYSPETCDCYIRVPSKSQIGRKRNQRRYLHVYLCSLVIWFILLNLLCIVFLKLFLPRLINLTMLNLSDKYDSIWLVINFCMYMLETPITILIGARNSLIVTWRNFHCYVVLEKMEKHNFKHKVISIDFG